MMNLKREQRLKKSFSQSKSLGVHFGFKREREREREKSDFPVKIPIHFQI